VMEWSQVQDIITSARYDRKGDFVMVGSHTGTVNVLRGGMGSAAGQSAAAAPASSSPDGAEAGLRYVTEVVCRNHSGKYSDGRKVTGLDFNGDLMLVTTNDSRLRVFSVSSDSVPRISLLCKLKGIVNLELQIKGKFSEDGRLVVCGSEDGHIAVWELPPEVTDRSRRGDPAAAKVLKINAREEFQAMGSIVTSAQFLSRKAITEVKGGRGEQETAASRRVTQAVIAGSYQGEVKVFESRAVLG
jgi:WD40 repeat protein